MIAPRVQTDNQTKQRRNKNEEGWVSERGFLRQVADVLRFIPDAGTPATTTQHCVRSVSKTCARAPPGNPCVVGQGSANLVLVLLLPGPAAGAVSSRSVSIGHSGLDNACFEATMAAATEVSADLRFFRLPTTHQGHQMLRTHRFCVRQRCFNNYLLIRRLYSLVGRAPA